uniref:Uncharacterized protein n=1 Tax=Plectus sambesii TaxID=2011161 RepID=A0A914WEY9_9BILA
MERRVRDRLLLPQAHRLATDGAALATNRQVWSIIRVRRARGTDGADKSADLRDCETNILAAPPTATTDRHGAAHNRYQGGGGLGESGRRITSVQRSASSAERLDHDAPTAPRSAPSRRVAQHRVASRGACRAAFGKRERRRRSRRDGRRGGDRADGGHCLLVGNRRQPYSAGLAGPGAGRENRLFGAAASTAPLLSTTPGPVAATRSMRPPLFVANPHLRLLRQRQVGAALLSSVDDQRSDSRK